MCLRAAITSGPDPFRIRLASSRSVLSRTPYRPFSIPRGRESGRGVRGRQPAPAALWYLHRVRIYGLQVRGIILPSQKAKRKPEQSTIFSAFLSLHKH